jgi:signal peptidase I
LVYKCLYSACSLFSRQKFAFDIVRINNKDMHDTYKYGDALLIKKSFNKYNTGDVVYLEYPLKDSALSRTFFVQRIYGLPGDSLQIIDKKVYINVMQLLDTSSLKHNYFVKSIQKLDSNFRLNFGLTEGGEVSIGLRTSARVKFLKKNIRNIFRTNLI